MSAFGVRTGAKARVLIPVHQTHGFAVRPRTQQIAEKCREIALRGHDFTRVVKAPLKGL